MRPQPQPCLRRALPKAIAAAAAVAALTVSMTPLAFAETVGNITTNTLAASQAACTEGDRDESKRIAASGDFIEHKATSGDLEVTLRYSEDNQCYWGLINGVTKLQSGAIWLERRDIGSNEESQQFQRHTTHVLTPSTYTAPIQQQSGKEVRACGATLTLDLGKLAKSPSEQEKNGYSEPPAEVGEPVCTDWYG